MYYKKRAIAPLKAKKRIVLGMREIEKHIKLNEVLVLFVVPYIEKVVEIKNSLDDRLISIFEECHKKEIPIWISDYGLADYGTGAIMCVPAHDTRDFAFAKKWHKICIFTKKVVTLQRIFTLGNYA